MSDLLHSAQDALAGRPGARNGMSEGEYCLQRLRTFERRHGRPLNTAQREQLEALEHMQHKRQSVVGELP